jgi:hypothetical protein
MKKEKLTYVNLPADDTFHTDMKRHWSRFRRSQPPHPIIIGGRNSSRRTRGAPPLIDGWSSENSRKRHHS